MFYSLIILLMNIGWTNNFLSVCNVGEYRSTAEYNLNASRWLIN